MQAKIGIDGSVDTNSLDYKIAHALQVIADEVRISSAMAGGGFFVEIPMEVSSHLSVVGGGASLFQLQSSGYGAGKVLISDVNGNADWKSLATADIVTKTGNEFIDGIKTFQKPVY